MDEIHDKEGRVIGHHRPTEGQIRASLCRVTDSLATLVREHSNPGSEALAALDEARRVLSR